ncbi:MAG: flagellum-specific peptidoglycan hydrolase FlgJ [Patiriisocius sp.]|jgi:flagellum-specific peptidoglycan hydrolase FlgJ
MKLKIVFSILFLLALSNCGAKKSVVHKKNTGVAIQESKPKDLPSVNEVKFTRKLAKKYPRLNKETLAYIRKYAPIAVKEMHEYKIPASITLAQGILESGKGKSELALKSNNHFGIKCHRKWTGERVYHDDDEKGECFRKYRYPETSYNDHSLFLTQRKRYAFLFDYNIKNYKKWAYGLRKAGYATDRKYPMKLLKIIKDYHLYEFDNFIKRNNTKRFKEVKKLESSEKQLLKLKQNSYEVKKGDTLYSISRMFSVSVQSLKAINNLKDNALAIGQKLIVQE